MNLVVYLDAKIERRGITLYADFKDIRASDSVWLPDKRLIDRRYFVHTRIKTFGEVVRTDVFRYYGKWYGKISPREARPLVPNGPFGVPENGEVLEFTPGVLVGNLELSRY